MSQRSVTSGFLYFRGGRYGAIDRNIGREVGKSRGGFIANRYDLPVGSGISADIIGVPGADDFEGKRAVATSFDRFLINHRVQSTVVGNGYAGAVGNGILASQGEAIRKRRLDFGRNGVANDEHVGFGGIRAGRGVIWKSKTRVSEQFPEKT